MIIFSQEMEVSERLIDDVLAYCLPQEMLVGAEKQQIVIVLHSYTERNVMLFRRRSTNISAVFQYVELVRATKNPMWTN